MSKLEIGINSALPDIDNIKVALKARGVILYSIFGTGEMPEHRVLAMSPRLSKSSQRELLKLAQELGFTHFSYYTHGDEDIFEDALLGGYGEPERELL